MCNRLFILGLIVSLFCVSACKESPSEPMPCSVNFINGADLSSLPQIQSHGLTFSDRNGNPGAMLDLLKQEGMNTVRIRLWHTPETEHSSFEEVKQFAQTVKDKGLKVWLTVHCSDHWADPAQQVTPAAWSNLTFDLLKDSLYNYVTRVVTEIPVDIIQVGNELNSGMLHPYGDIQTNEAQFIELEEVALGAVREHAPSVKTMIHYAGYEGSDWFFSNFAESDYDYIGLSYYPYWHGQDLEVLRSTIASLRADYNKEVLLAEVAYPFTLDWNDWTDNVFGTQSQLILPAYPATKAGQKDFMDDLAALTLDAGGSGFCYWGAELVAFDGPESTDGSVWENLALFDFENKMVPAVSAFVE